MARTLVALPNEIKHLILEECNLDDLRSISATCPTLYYVACRRFYRTLDLRTSANIQALGPDWPSNSSRSQTLTHITTDRSTFAKTLRIDRPQGCLPPLGSLKLNDYPTQYRPRTYLVLRTLLENPSLAVHVKHLGLVTPGKNEECSGSVRNRVPDLSQEQRLFESALQDAAVPDFELWREAILTTYDPDALAALLIWKCSRIETLDLVIQHYRRSQWLKNLFGNALGTAGDSHRRLSHLKRVTISKVGMRNKPLEDLLSFLLYLPVLSSLTISNSNPRVRNSQRELPQNSCLSWASPQPPVASQLTELVLAHTSAMADDVDLVLGSTPALITFHYHCMIPVFGFLDCDRLNQALDKVKDTLKNLRVSYSISHNDSSGILLPRIYQGRLGSLREFPSLETLEVAPLLFTSHQEDSILREGPPLAQLLPPSLRRLTLTNNIRPCQACGWACFLWPTSLCHFLGAYDLGFAPCRTATPLLRVVVFELCNTMHLEGMDFDLFSSMFEYRKMRFEARFQQH